MNIQNTKLYTYMQGVFVVVLQVVILLTTFFVATKTIAQELSLSSEIQPLETKEVQITEPISEPLIKKEPLPIQEPSVSEPIFSPEQQQELAKLEGQLKTEKITQEEYDKQKAEIIGITPLSLESGFALASRSSIEIEPEAQTLGKYIAPSVSTTNGSLNYSYPIILPPGRNGLTPELNLTYNSGNKSQSSLIGTGWSLDIPYIQRMNKTGIDNLYTDNYFTSSIDGELVHQGNGIYTPRVENGSFLKYEYINDVWTVTDKTGTKYEFGATVQARQDNPIDATQIFSWMLETVTDTNGNAINYSYYKDQGQIYPDSIQYVDGFFKVNFNRVHITNDSVSYVPRFEVKTKYRIESIQVNVDNIDTINYGLNSETDNLLQAITTKSLEGEVIITPPTPAEYWQADSNFELPVDDNGNVIRLEYNQSNSYGSVFIDLNQDTLPDILHWKKGVPNSHEDNVVYLHTGNGWVKDTTYSYPVDASGNVVAMEYTGSNTYGSRVIDVNGDLLPDLVRWHRSYSNADVRNEVYINTGTTWVLDSSFLLPTDPATGNVITFSYNKRHDYGSALKDINNDGYIDIVAWDTRYNNSHQRNEVYLGTGTGWTADPNFLLPSDPVTGKVRRVEYSRSTSVGSVFTDINNDGYTDILNWGTGQNNSHPSNEVYLGTGTGWVADPNFLLPVDANGNVIRIEYTNRSTYGSLLRDVNNDGFIDIITWKSGVDNTHADNKVYINNGNGWDYVDYIHLPTKNGQVFTIFYNKYYYGTIFEDVDADGYPDIVQWQENKTNTHADNEIYRNVTAIVQPEPPAIFPEFELPPVEFEYHVDSGSTWLADTSSYDLPEPIGFADDDGDDRGTRILDINGDGYVDVVRYYDADNNGTDVKKVWLNNGDNTWSESTSWNWSDVSYPFSDWKESFGYEFADVDGDSLVDIIYADYDSFGTQKVFLNTGSGWSEDTSWSNSLPQNFYFKKFYNARRYDTGARIRDINGDHLPDLLESYEYNGVHTSKVYLNTGTGWQEELNSFSIPEPFTIAIPQSGRGRDFGVRLQDINADGLTDIIRATQSINKVYLNTGSGWVLSNISFPIHFVSTNGSSSTPKDNGVRFGEINGDGYVDVIYSVKDQVHKSGIYINNGHGWDTSTIYPPQNTFFNDLFETSYPRQFLDIDADGLSDIVTAYLDSGSITTTVWHNSFDDSRSIKKITNEHSGSVQFEYQTTHELNTTHNYAPLSVVSSQTTDDNNGIVAVTSYDYRGADYYFNTPHDRKFAGFSSTIKTNPDGSVETTKYHQANGEQGNEPTDSYAKIGKVYEQRIEDAGGNLFTLNRTNYTETNLGGTSNSVQVASELTQQYDGTTSHTDIASEYLYDAYGNVSTQTEFGEVNGNADGTFTDIGTDKRTVDYTYITNTADYIVGLPTNRTLKNNSNVKEAETNYSYDTDGNLLTESNWIDSTDYADTTYTYNSYGLPLTQTDALNNTTTYVYDVQNLYPASVTNAENQVRSYTYDYSSGKPTQITEANGKVTAYEYDGLDRLLESSGTVANGGTEILETRVYNTQANPQFTKATTYTGTESQDIYTYTDGFGKTIQTKSETDTDWLTLDTIYDEMGRVEKQSLPYETSSSSYSSGTTNNNLLTSFIYDAIGRVLTTSNAKGTTTTSYDGFETSIIDAENNQKDLVTDAFGNLLQVKEYNGGSVYTTNYEYDTRNLLTKITDAENNERNIAYDGLGRRTLLEDLHSSSDTTFGTWSFVYDDINLTSQTDPNGSITSYTYDDINRVLTEDNDGTAGVEISYVYDTCTHGTGQLCSVTTPDTSTSYTYLKQGLVDTETITIDGVNYTTDSDYDRLGNVTKVTHPNASTTEYGYNTRNLVDDVIYNGTSLVTANYGVHGRPTSQTHANGVSSTYSYDANNLYELTSKITTDGTTNFQELSYTYDDVGNITQIVDASNTDTAKTQSFVYDDLYRLTSTTVTNSANTQDYTRNYAYSPIGNITAFNGVNYSYTDSGYSNPHAVTDINGTAYSYNNNGNLTSDGTWTHNWDYRNRLVSSSDGANTSSYEYDYNNNRTKLVEGTDTTIYPSASYEVLNGNAKVSLSLGEMLVATDDNGTINHIHTDHLGGTNITTDTTGAITQTLDYYPFGDTRIDTGSDNETKQYTGYTKDVSTGLHYAGARYYGNDIGRFISQDPVALALGDWNSIEQITRGDTQGYLSNPQKHNAYSYAFNNPLKYDDNNGEFGILTQLASFAAYQNSTEYLGERLYQNGYGEAAIQLSNDNKNYDFAISNPEITGLVTGGASAIAAAGLVEGALAYQGAIATSKLAGASIVNVAGKAGYAGFSIHVGSQALPQANNLLSSLSDLELGKKGAALDTFKNAAFLFGPQALPKEAQLASDIVSTTFETLNSLIPKNKSNSEESNINDKSTRNTRRTKK